jgi:hypothetical protein
MNTPSDVTLLNRAICIIAGEFGKTREEVMEWLTDADSAADLDREMAGPDRALERRKTPSIGCWIQVTCTTKVGPQQ